MVKDAVVRNLCYICNTKVTASSILCGMILLERKVVDTVSTLKLADAKEIETKNVCGTNLDFVRVLISSSTDVMEADDVIQKYGIDENSGSLKGEETVSLLEKKIAYVCKLFEGVHIFAREEEANEFMIAQTDYYAILSTLIRQRWGDF